MKRTLNYTGRRRIPRSEVSVRITDDGKAFTVDLHTNFDEFPAGAKIVAEAYERTVYERHELSTLPDRPERGPFLFELVDNEAALFRIKVVREDGESRGTLLAVADKVPPSNSPDPGDESSDQRRVSLLHAKAAALDGAAIRLSLENERFPVLEYEQSLAPSGFAHFIAEDSRFRSLVLPEVVRQVLTHLVVIDRADDDADGTWQTEWLRLASGWVHSSPPSDEAEVELQQRWVDDAVAAFSRRINTVKEIGELLGAKAS